MNIPNDSKYITIEFEEEYTRQFNLIRFEDISEGLADRYFRVDDDWLCPPVDDPFFAVNSQNACIRTLDAGYEPQLLIINNRIQNMDMMEKVKMTCPTLPVCLIDNDSPILPETEGEMARYGFDYYGVSVLFKKKSFVNLVDILCCSRKIVVFHGFEATRGGICRLGADARSAAALFADAVLYQGRSIDPYDSRLIRCANGIGFQIPFTVYRDDEELSRELDKYGYTSVLLSHQGMDGAIPIYEIKPDDRRIALIFDAGVMNGQNPDAALRYDISTYVPGKPFPGPQPRFTAIALYQIFSEGLNG